MGRKLQKFRESVNVSIYDSKSTALNILRVLRLLVSLLSIGNIIYYYGFPHSEATLGIQLFLLRFSLLFFVISYIVRFLYTFEPAKFLWQNKIEGITLGLVILDGLGMLFFGVPFLRKITVSLGFSIFSDFFMISVQSVLMIIIFMELMKMGQKVVLLQLSPSILFILSFVFLILAGTALLMMPEMSHSPYGMGFLDALFTSTSACCVTGLSVVDTATFFTLKGKLILMLLMQLGGLNIIIFASFFAYFSQKGIGLKQQAMVMDFMSFESLHSTKRMLRDIFALSIGIEFVGAVLMYFMWHPDLHFESPAHRFFYSAFHSVSAFNNAGFSLFTNNLYEPVVRESYMIHIIIGALIVAGGLGFPVLTDLFGIKQLRDRLRHPWKQIRTSTKIVVNTSLLLVLAGAVVFYFLEEQNVLEYATGGFAEKKPVQKIITSVFHSVSARTAGFNSVDFTIVSPPVLLFFIFLMFIGASPASTGGGIKTTTFAVIFLSALATIRNRKLIQVFRVTIPDDIVRRAFSIVLFSGVVVFTAVFIISITDPGLDMLKIFFEVVSAFCTVGLSAGITAGLSVAGKYVLIACMFIGRVGILTLAVALTKKARSNNYKYPDTYVMVG